jgi:hypothetical protein
MEIKKPDYIGEIIIKSIRDYILDSKLTDEDTIVLHTLNFDDIVLEYRDTYKEAIKMPFFLLGVLIDEDIEIRVPKDKIVVIKKDTRHSRIAMNKKEIAFQDPKYIGTKIYRCGWCGNIVDFKGLPLDYQQKNHSIMLLQNHSKYVTTTAVNGYCCPNGNQV